ncbi:MAG: sel1 repeat family protein [Emcibacter sp.]|nr:sel1 repeat family protein [Emcibacter sp.]
MFKKSSIIILAISFGMTLSVAQAATRMNAPFEMAKLEDPAAEGKCLDAFVKSDFIYAHRLCLSLARIGMRDAQLVTGLMYAFGEGTRKNPDMAELWLNEAVRNGSTEAQEVLNGIKLMN